MTNGQKTLADALQAVAGAPPERYAAICRAAEPVQQQNHIDAPLLMSMGEAAKFAGLSRSTLWRCIKAGRIKTVEVLPGMHRVPRAALQSLAGGPS